MEAPDARAVIERLHKESYFPVRVAPYAERKMWPTFGEGRIRQRDLLAMTQQLATLFEAGLPPDPAPAIPEKLRPRPKPRALLPRLPPSRPRRASPTAPLRP